MIEDDAECARMARRALAPCSYEIYHTPKGLEGLRMARELLPDIVLVDMNLPDLEGKVIVTQLRGRILSPSSAIIAFTAEDDARTRRVTRMLGCDDLIGKPIDTRTFADQIAQTVQRKVVKNG
jgi:DNA-binding response OmpR family regulator